jgi:hypothetical protein
MSFDDLLDAMIIAGIGLSGTYLRAAYVLRRKIKSAERREALGLSEILTSRRTGTHGTQTRTGTVPMAEVVATALVKTGNKK